MTFGCLYVTLGLRLGLFLTIAEATTRREAQMSKILDSLLAEYDKDVIPTNGGSPVTVWLDVFVRTMGFDNDQGQTYTMDCYFRQIWYDRRLSFNNQSTLMNFSIKDRSISVNPTMLTGLWLPDTIIRNDRQSHAHMVTRPNKFLRIRQDGQIYYSQRLTIKAMCGTHLESFPMDIINCYLAVSSFAYANDDLKYEWARPMTKSNILAPQIRFSQFDLINIESRRGTTLTMTRNQSVVVLCFHLKRHLGYYLIQVYIPCGMLVMLSWIGLWLNHEAISDRISLGLMTILTLCFIMMDHRQEFPIVSSVTAVDRFFIWCFIFVFTAIVEIAAIHFLSVYYCNTFIGDEYYLKERIMSTEAVIPMSSFYSRRHSLPGTADEPIENNCCHNQNDKNLKRKRRLLQRLRSTGKVSFDLSVDDHKEAEQNAAQTANTKRRRTLMLDTQFVARWRPDREEKIDGQVVVRIEKFSRALFPLAFTLFNAFYWTGFPNMGDIWGDLKDTVYIE